MDAIEIKYQLARLGVSSEEVAEKAGCAQATVSKAIHRKIPGAKVWPALIEVLGYDPREVEGDSPAPHPEREVPA